VSPHGRIVVFPGVWSPDSRSIAFSLSASPEIEIVDATSGAQTTSIPFNGFGLVDWQALPGGSGARCTDYGFVAGEDSFTR
jgi:hypothetical protein